MMLEQQVQVKVNCRNSCAFLGPKVRTQTGLYRCSPTREPVWQPGLSSCSARTYIHPPLRSRACQRSPSVRSAPLALVGFRKVVALGRPTATGLFEGQLDSVWRPDSRCRRASHCAPALPGFASCARRLRRPRRAVHGGGISCGRRADGASGGSSMLPVRGPQGPIISSRNRATTSL